MEELLPFYERELGFLRNSSREFALRYPKIAVGLGMTGETCEDPHIERMIESFALLTARISKKLDDDYPEFTEALFEVLYPHYLRPFPSCSIVQFDLGPSVAELKKPFNIRRETELKSLPINNIPCRFRTVYDVDLSPIKIERVRYYPTPSAPSNARIPPGTSGRLSISLSLDDALTFGSIDVAELRCYLHGESSLVAALRDCLFMNVADAYIETKPDYWQRLEKVPVEACGFNENESLIDFPASSHPAYRLLTEYFVFQEKFNFFDLKLDESLVWAKNKRRFNLHLLVRNLPADSNVAKLLEMTSRDNIRLGCTPIINLFEQKADPIRVTHTTSGYTVLADSRRAFGYEIYSIDKVLQVQQSAAGEDIVEFRPFYSLHHGEDPNRVNGYWFSTRDNEVAERSPGYETEISLIDSNFDPLAPRVDTLSISLTCTNRDLPTQLAIGQSGGDLTMDGGSVVSAIKMLRRPTASVRFSKGRGAHWRLISHLSLNHLSLVESGLSALKETLVLYNLSNSAVSAKQIEGLVAVDYKPATLWMEGAPFATFIRGVEIRLTVDQAFFVGTSLDTFVSVLNKFFGLYVHLNNFIQLVVLSSDGTELIRCEPCSGEVALV